MLSGPWNGGCPGGGFFFFFVGGQQEVGVCVGLEVCHSLVTLEAILALQESSERQGGPDSKDGRQHASSASDRPEMDLGSSQSEA